MSPDIPVENSTLRTGHTLANRSRKRQDQDMAPIVLYDGTCGLCHKSVQWLLRHERDHVVQFAALQGETADKLRARFPEIPTTLETIVLVDEDRALLRSKAFL